MARAHRQERDKPVQSVLGDAALVEIAKRKPTLRASWKTSAASPRTACASAAVSCWKPCSAACRKPRTARGSDPRPPQPRPDDVPLIALCEALVRARAREAGLAYELLAARADLQAIVIAQRAGERADVRTLRGWRAELVGNELLELLERPGRLSFGERPAPGGYARADYSMWL